MQRTILARRWPALPQSRRVASLRCFAPLRDVPSRRWQGNSAAAGLSAASRRPIPSGTYPVTFSLAENGSNEMVMGLESTEGGTIELARIAADKLGIDPKQYSTIRQVRNTSGGKPAPKLGYAPKKTKRRQAAASQDLRHNPPPTRGPELECIAYSTAERYDLAELAANLRKADMPYTIAPNGTSEDQAIVITLSTGDAASEGDLSLQEAGPSALNSAAAHRASFREFGNGETGEIWAFKSGSFVTWGLSSLQGLQFLKHVVRLGGRRGGGIVESGRYEQIQTEEVDFVVDHTKWVAVCLPSVQEANVCGRPQRETLIKGNLVILGKPPVLDTFEPNQDYAALLTRYTLSLALARSSALSAIEAKLDSHLDSVSKLPHMLAVTGKQPMKRNMVIRKIGELMMLREAVNFRGGGLEDTPEIYWSEPVLEGEAVSSAFPSFQLTREPLAAYFDSVSEEFELKERIDAVNQKVDYANEVQSTLRALLTEVGRLRTWLPTRAYPQFQASGHRMELIIIALIAVEVCIVLIREGRELYHTAASWFSDDILEFPHGDDHRNRLSATQQTREDVAEPQADTVWPRLV